MPTDRSYRKNTVITRIENVRIADGSGGEVRSGSVRFDRRILDDDGRSDEVIDGQGMLLAPGFIDAHGHSDISALASPECCGKISQGFTTEISGNCGLSPFPLSCMNRAHLEELYAGYRTPMPWHDCGEYLRHLAEHGVRLKLVPLCGHNTLRSAVAGYETRTLTSGQLAEMCRLLDKELSGGAAGLSSGLLYTPGCFSSRREITELLKCVALHGGIYATHLRSEGNMLLESLQETVEAASSAGLDKIHISHFKTAGAGNWHKLDAALALLDEAEKSGISVTFDRYPYLESMTQLSVIAEGRFSGLDDSALMRLLQEPGASEELAGMLNRDWSKTRLASTGLDDFAGYSGMTFDNIAALTGKSPSFIAAELLRRDACGCMAAFQGMSGKNLRRIIADCRCFCGTDESARPLDFSIGRSHPRGFGSLAHFWHLLAEAGISAGNIVRRLSALPAERFGLRDRGYIRPGLCADLVLLDEKNLDSCAGFTAPHTPSKGIKHVWTDGVKVF